MIDLLCYFFIFFGGFMSWTMALRVFLEDNKRDYHYFFGGFMFCLGSLQILDGLVVMGIIGYFPLFIFWHLPLLAWLGPTFFFSFKSANDEAFKFKSIQSLHFLSGILVTLLLIPLFALDTQTRLSFIMTPPDITNPDPFFQLFSVLYIAVVCTLMGYVVYFFKECYFMLDIRLIREKKISPYITIIMVVGIPFLIVFFVSILITSLMGYGRSLYIPIIQLLTTLSFLVTLEIFIMEQKNINFFKLLETQIRKSKYEFSQQQNHDISLVVSRIDSLMEKEKIFCDEDLSLYGLADKLHIKPYLLSRIINNNFGKNFNYFVNEYRIEEAKKIVSEENDRTIISIAYAVGFNSTSVFNEWFKRITGVSPKQFRNRINNKQQVRVTKTHEIHKYNVSEV